MARPHRAARALSCIALAGLLSLTAACNGSGAGSGDQVTITIAGPNQWNSDPKSFGPAWEDLVKRFEEKEPGIKVETTVLPIPDFVQTLSTQLTAGTAPELVFNQAPHQPDQVVALDDYLTKPNPYVPGNQHWIDIFNPDQFGPKSGKVRNAAGHYEWVPFNLVTIGLYYNVDAFAKAGVQAPLKTYGDFLTACPKLKAAGYAPLAMDNGWLGQGWTYNVVMGMLMDKYYAKWNQFDADGKPGKAAQLTAKSVAHAILTGELDPTSTPEVAEGLRLIKKMFDACATPNWSGIAGGASFVGGNDFVGGKAAIAWGTNFADSSLDEVTWKHSTMPFPTITSADTSVSDGTPARFGAEAGGTSYMIPSTTKGKQLDAAVKFLQFASSTEGGQAWLDKSGGIPATRDGKAAPGLQGLMSGEWFNHPPRVMGLDLRPKALAGKPVYDGYLLGTKSESETMQKLKEDWTAAVKEQAKDAGWTEAWAK
ncbi:ABC transporter substrate-binding protein [Kribbella sp. NPDC059898]|uniref:ABC transporter substrate-binding protein n=1 Tax=Kribbella sp. NPDC059898 TaxID=3346995 RepID=UPI00366482AB